MPAAQRDAADLALDQDALETSGEQVVNAGVQLENRERPDRRLWLDYGATSARVESLGYSALSTARRNVSLCVVSSVKTRTSVVRMGSRRNRSATALRSTARLTGL
jgi:hypothetical protein